MHIESNAVLDDVAVGTHGTAIGRLTFAASGDALLYCGFAPPEAVRRRLSQKCRNRTGEAAPPRAVEIIRRARAQVDEYLAGRRRAFCVPLDLRLATPFGREVVLALDDLVPYGQKITYAELAAALGRPRAARAVGAALGANPLCVVLPCHRVVGSSGRLTGYAGGTAAKRFLLELEAEPGRPPAAMETPPERTT